MQMKCNANKCGKMHNSGSDPITDVILLNKKARVNVVEREQPTMLSVNTDILRNKGEWQCFVVHASKT